jgi:hypothetical protein
MTTLVNTFLQTGLRSRCCVIRSGDAFSLARGRGQIAWASSMNATAKRSQMQPILTNAATAVHDFVFNIQVGATALQTDWHGNRDNIARRNIALIATGGL